MADRDLQYRIVHFEACDQYVGVAWNYDIAALISTSPMTSYVTARRELEKCVDKANRNLRMRWFDGEYRVPRGSDQMLKLSTEERNAIA